ncbi:MAG: tryptophan--tRNA ligase [Planctomycetes bacterium]|nr:tryptophan--tRNA ligase [Planctomycetota bacterium]
MSTREVILTGDTPTGQLHLGHYFGSVRRRVELQETHDCYFLLANMHAYTTRSEYPDEIHSDTLEIVRDYLAMGIDPNKAAILLQSETPAIAELTFLFSMLLPFNRVMRNPTLKEEIKVKGLGENYSFGFPLYAVGQTADILAFRAHAVPVGEDQVPHIELTREVARRFNKLYCGIDENVEDDDPIMIEKGIFPIPRADVGKVGKLVGTDGVNKMSKSLNNTILITDTPKKVKRKLGQLYTGRQSMTDPGDPDSSLMQYVDIFITDTDRAAELKDKYVRGDNIGDGHIKVEVAEAISGLLAPMQERRSHYDGDDDTIIDIIRDGTARANIKTEETLAMAKEASGLGYFSRAITFGDSK